MFPAGTSGPSSSTSCPRWNVDLNAPPRDEAEVPVQEPEEGYRGEDPDPIRAALNARLEEKISLKEIEIRKVVEEFFEAEIEKRNLARSHFDFRNLDNFVENEVVGRYAFRYDHHNLESKNRSFSRLLTDLRKEDSSVNYQVKRNIERNLLAFIVQE